jgi:hypothetical protein
MKKTSYFILAILIFNLHADNNLSQTQIADQKVFLQHTSRQILTVPAQKIQEFAQWSSRLQKARLALGIGLTSLACIYGYVFYSEYTMHHHEWGLWKENVPLAALKEMNPQDILKELIKKKGGAHPIQTLLKILQEIEAEHTRLQRYMRLQSLKVFFVLPYQRLFRNKVYEQLLRLDFLKYTILNNITIAQ